MKKKLYRCLGISVWILLVFLKVSAQSRPVTGTVNESSGSNLPGVSVNIKGTTMGTVTDANGNYTVNASASDVLMFSFIGYTTEEITVGQQTSINVTLTED